MVRRVVVLALLWLTSIQVSAERLRFEGSFDSYYRCDAAGCSQPVAVEPIAFAFTIDVTQPVQSGSTQVPRWVPPSFGPASTAPLDRATFESLIDPVTVTSHHHYNKRDPLHRLLIWDGSNTRAWKGTDPERPTTTLNYYQSLGAELVGERPNTDPASSVTFAELVGLFDEYLATGRSLHVSDTYAWYRQGSEGFVEGVTNSLSGSFRLTGIQCRAPSSLATVLGRLRPGG